MMMNAYDEKYLYDGMHNLGEAFDYVVNYCDMDMDDFMKIFISTGYAERFGCGEPKIVAGLSGTELAIEVMSKSGMRNKFPEPQFDYDCSAEYWCGYILAYYQWKTGNRFKDIHARIDMNEVYKLYPTLHEAAEDKFVDTVNAIAVRRKVPTKLQIQRKICGLTQKELSVKTGLNLRTLQQYETRAKDLGQAAVSTVITLSRVLGCGVKDLV